MNNDLLSCILTTRTSMTTAKVVGTSLATIIFYLQ